MAGSWSTERFPKHKDALVALVEQHRELKDEPLHLALAYLPSRRAQHHIYLFEVIGSASRNINWEPDLFEVSFLPKSGFPLDQDEELHFILTNPHELEIAIQRDWPLLLEVTDAILAGDYQMLFQDEIGKALLDQLQGVPHRLNLSHG